VCLWDIGRIGENMAIKIVWFKGVKKTERGLLPFGPAMLHEEGPYAKEGKHPHPIIVVVIKNKNNAVLLQRRSKLVTSPGKLDFSAAGHIDYGETVEEAAIRETREELGTGIRNLRLLTEKGVHLSDKIHIHFIVEAELIGKIKPGPEVDPDGTRFYPLDEIAELIKTDIVKTGVKNYFRKIL